MVRSQSAVRRPRPLLVWVLALGVVGTDSLEGQSRAPSDTTDSALGVSPYPQLQTKRELALLGFGLTFHGVHYLVPDPVRALPPSGLDADGIPWSLDRNAVGPVDDGKSRASDWTQNGAFALPLVLSWLIPGDGDRWRSAGGTAIVLTEALVITGGLTMLGKASFGRARPFAYLPVNERPPGAATEVPSVDTFYSMPSGHSSTAWTSASVALTEHLLRRPEAHWAERLGVGFAAGALAGATSALRVEAGVHFPSDVVAGAGLGVLSGVAVPLAHRGERPMPTRRAWLEVAGGTVAGTLLGVVLAR